MKYTRTILLLAGLAIALVAPMVASAEGVSTFASFYDESQKLSLGTSAIIALAVGILVFIGAVVAFPATIAAIGTSIGGLYGLSGAAATNFGLALLGGGSVISGGFGMAGGVAVLAAALTFTTEVGLDYAAGKAFQAYSRQSFQDNSLSMMTLPLPLENSGPPDSVEAAGDILRNSKSSAVWECISRMPKKTEALQGCYQQRTSRGPRDLVQEAITIMDGYTNLAAMKPSSLERKSAMYALLYFINNDYSAATDAAQVAYGMAIKGNHTPTLPAFIKATGMLYEEQPDFSTSFDYFKYSITAEPTNALTPVMFSAYLDRLSYRLNDRAASVTDLARIDGLTTLLADDPRRLAAQQIVLSHYMMQIYVTQQRILSLSKWRDASVDSDAETLQILESSFEDHKALLAAAAPALDYQEALIKSLTKDPSWWDRLVDRKTPWGEDPTSRQKLLSDWSADVSKYRAAVADYKNGTADLAIRVRTFEKRLSAPRDVL